MPKTPGGKQTMQWWGEAEPQDLLAGLPCQTKETWLQKIKVTEG